MDNKLEIAKKVIKEYFNEGQHGIFNNRNIAGDQMTTLYNKDGLTVDICFYYEYFEVFGLSSSEFKELKEYYSSLGGHTFL